MRIFFTAIKRIFERDRGTCQQRDFGCTVAATEVDHIISVAELGIPRADANDDENLRAICSSCHRRKTQREALAGAQRRKERRHLPRQPHPGD